VTIVINFYQSIYSYNQRTPAIAPLKNGGFVVAWFPNNNDQRLESGGYNELCSVSSLVLRVWMCCGLYAKQWRAKASVNFS